MKYLGHIIGSGKHRPDPQRLQAVEGMKPPSTKKQLQSVLGLFNYYRDYVPNFAAIAKPLTDLTAQRKPKLLIWGESEQRAYELLKDKICHSPVLAVPQPGKPFLWYTDASEIAVGCQLAQYDDEGNEHPVAYASSKLNATQRNWAVIEREAYAVVWALGHYRNMIFGAPLAVYCDHNPLKYLTQSAPKSAKLTRWSLALQEYDLTNKYVKGKANLVAVSYTHLTLPTKRIV